MLSHRGRRFAAFSLVELLVVIGIIALLISILLPAISRAREAAQATQRTSNLRQIDIAINLWAMDRSPKSASMRWPNHVSWTDAVLTIDRSGRTLYCPTAPKTETVVAAFTPPGVTHSKTSNGAGHPSTVWVPDPAVDPTANSYAGTLKYQNNKPDLALFTVTRVDDKNWQFVATRIDAGGPSGGPPINVTWGTDSWTNVVKNAVLNHAVASAGGTNYGYNVQMSDTRRRKPGRVIAMDYPKTSIDFDGDAASGTDDLPDTHLLGRHLKRRTPKSSLADTARINVLFSDSSVQSLRPSEISPINSRLYRAD